MPPGPLKRSVSSPSMGTLETSTIKTNATSRASGMIKSSKSRPDKLRGKFLWEGRKAAVTLKIVSLPWNMWWQTLLHITITYKFVVHFLLAYYLDISWSLLDATLIISELIFVADLAINLLHNFWPLIRLHIRVYRRSYFFLAYDVFSTIPFAIIFRINDDYPKLLLFGRWLGICRIYRLIVFFYELNGKMRSARKVMFMSEHITITLLVLHAATCLWYFLHRPRPLEKPWHNLGYPPHVSIGRLTFNNYLECWYYCSCRFFNVIFADTFPIHAPHKWLTIVLTLSGYVFLRYRFIGYLSWELVLENKRWSDFVELYHHMLSYLKFCGAPAWLVEQAQNYKLQLWNMKDGILTSDHLKKLPHPLQMQLIFDINVGHFHNSLLFRDTGEAFMRQVSLLMRHEIFLAGQQIWSQGVVKNGMICIKHGVIEMLSDEDDESPMIAFKEGTVLGELSLFYSIPAKVTVTAATYVELQVLRRTDFMRAMTENPYMLQQIRTEIDKRLNSSKRRQRYIVEYDKGDSRLLRTRYRPMKVLKDNLAGVEEEDPTFVDDSHMYFKDERNDRLPKFTSEYLELYQLSTNVTTIDAPRVCLKSNFPWILEPDTSFTNVFDIMHFIMVLYVCLMSPYHAIEHIQSDTHKILSIIVLAGLLLNIYIQLTTAIIHKNVRLETVKSIAEVKMASVGFYLDILSVFPIHIFSETLDPRGESVCGQVAKLFPTLQVWHLWAYIAKWEKNFNCHLKFLCLCKYGLILFIFCYWSGCFLYLFACPKKLCVENSWMSRLIFWETKVFVVNTSKHERPLLSSLSFGTSIFTGSGTAEMGPGNRDLIVVVFLFAMGTYMSCFYTAKVCSLFMLSTQRKLKFKESMRELFYFLTVNRVSGKIKARVEKFFCVQWYYNNAVSTEEIFKDMSSNIQQEVLSIEMVKTLMFCPLFQECSRDFLQTVAANTRTIILPDNEVVQHAADIGRDMYILQKGHCNVLNHKGKVVMSIGPGCHFGVIEMLFGLPKVYTVLTTTNCKLRYVEYSALVQCWSTFPDISHLIILTLQDPQLLSLASEYDEAKPLTGRIDVKINRIAQEIKESFVVLSSREQRREYLRTFEKLGILRYVKYIFLPGCITPHGIFLKMWCALRFLLAFYYILTIPYNIATKQYKLGTTYPWTDVILYIDLVVMAYVSYYDERSILIAHPLLTVSRYLRQTFLLDALAVFPFEQLLRIVNENINLDLCRVNRLFLVSRITGAFSYWESDIMKLNTAVVLLKFLPLAVTFVNFMTAFIFMNSCKPYVPMDSPYTMVNCTKGLIINEKTIETTWCGCTTVTITTRSDVCLVMLMQIIGYLYFAFMFGYVASTRSAAAHALLEHTGLQVFLLLKEVFDNLGFQRFPAANKYTDILTFTLLMLPVRTTYFPKENTKDLENFLYQENVDPMLTAKTLKYFEYVWKRTNGSNPQQICRCLNSALMEDTLVFMYEHALREVPLFGKVERSFIRVITQHLHEMYFLKGETVVQCKDMQHYIYIIYRGKVDVMSSYNEMLTCMGPGGMFGNFTGQPTSCSDVSIFASRSLDLLVIPSQTFFNLVKYYPKIRAPLKKAFEVSKDYILPISMDNDMNSSSESEWGSLSHDSQDSRSGSSRYLMTGQLSTRSSHSSVSQAKSSVSMATSYQSYMHITNLLRPGSWLFQGFGYFTCLVVTLNYVILLYEIITLNDCEVVFWMQTIFDIFFYIKIYLNIHQGYVNKRGDLVTDPIKCRARYYKHKKWIWTEVLVNLPLEVFAFCFPKPLKVMHYLRINKLFRLKYLVEFYRKTAAELTNNLTTLQSATTMFVVILLIHSFTCIWLLALIFTSPLSLLRTLKIHYIDEETPESRWDYTTSLYIVVSELTTTGGDEFVIEEMLPLIILSLSLVCGKMLASIVVATCMQVAYSTRNALNTYEQTTKELIDMLKNQGLSSYQLKKFWRYVTQLWIYERGRQLPVLLAQTPYVRRCDLMSAMFGHHLRNCYLFADTGEPFLRQLTVVLDYTIFFPGNYIVVAGDSEARMYFVASGNVSVVSVRPDLTETTHELLGPGDVFGIIQGLNRGIAHCFSYRAETKVSILTLSLDSWINILPYFPESRKIIAERAEVLFAQI